MTIETNPFLDPARTRGDLYAEPERLARRTSALHTAKMAGPPVQGVIADLAADRTLDVVVDIGCGRGSTTAHLSSTWRPTVLIALDQSTALLAAARQRLPAGGSVRFVAADFHCLPLHDAITDVVVAAFCLYHSPQPASVVAEIARCLRPGGIAILVTKSLDSYRALDELVTNSGLDPDATRRPSLYETFHSGNIGSVTGSHLDVSTVIHHEHEFHFTGARHVADYLATTPKYQLTRRAASPERLAEGLRPHLGSSGLDTTSTVSYAVGTRR